MKILTSVEMGAVDRQSFEQFGISFDSLMENAGAAVSSFCLRQYPAANPIVVLCGKSNNGGDGFVAARCLALAGRSVQVVLLARISDLTGATATAFQRLQAETPSVAVHEAPDEPAMNVCGSILAEAGLLIDAVVGSGFTPPLREPALTARNLVEDLTVPVVAIDLPSGWDADSTSETAKGSFRADAVVTFTAPRNAHIFGHLTRNEITGGTFGPVVVAPIGSPDEIVQSCTGLTWAGTSKALAERPRGVNSNKGKFGHILIVGGSYGKAGAPSMASLAALRAGAGLVTAAVPKSICNTVARIAPEVMVSPLAEGSRGAVSFKNLDAGRLEYLFDHISIFAIGPGLSTEGDSSEFARHLVEKTNLPVVVDADALNAFAGKAHLLDGSRRPMVLTPHPGEMARLAGLTVPQVEADRIGLARRFATEHRLTLVLKGWRTLIAHPDGSIAVNTTGNPSMSKGGSGDILTGIIAAMLGQFPKDVRRAVETAVFLHGLAADFAAHAMDEHTVLATDTLDHLSDAFRYRVKDANGHTWITGLHS